MTTPEVLRLLFWTMSQPETIYVLGAGTSYGLVPFTPGLRGVMATEFHAPGVYSVEPPIATDLYRRIMTDSGKQANLNQILFRRISEPALTFFIQRALWRRPDRLAPPNYRVFRLIGTPSVLFNFNLDGMATFYCRNRHTVLEPHGSIDTEWFAPGIYEDLRDAVMSYDLVLPQIRYKLLPSPEPGRITLRFAYRALSRYFANAPGVLIIGYSFGRQQSGFDDSESLEFFVEFLRATRKHVFVLSPSPQELTSILQARLSSRAVTGVPLRWEVFARVLLSQPALLLNRARWSDCELADFTRRYIRAERIALAQS